MQINHFALPNLIVSIYLLILGCLAAKSNFKSNLNRNFFYLSLTTFAWLFSYGVAYLLNDYTLSLPFSKVGHSAAALLVPTVYCFMLEVLGERRKKIDIFLARLAILLSLIAIFLTFYSPLYFRNIEKRYWGYYPQGGIYMLAYTCWTFLVAYRAVWILHNESKQTDSNQSHNTRLKFGYYRTSLIIFIISAIDFLPKFGLNIYPFGFIFVAIFSSLITYAIIRHQILDTRIIVQRSFVYSSLIAVLTLIYLSLILISENLFRSYVKYPSIFTAIAISGIVSVTFNPLRIKLQRLIDKHFFHLDTEYLARENVLLKSAVQDHDRLKSVATLAAGMAHEIKNPLTSIRTFAEFLPKKYDDPDFRKKFSALVVDEVDRVNAIIQQLLDFSKPKELDLERFEISGLIQETLTLLGSNLLKNKIEVHQQVEAGLLVSGDKRQLKQVFLNLFLNAIQAMPNGGILMITAGLATEGGVSITVADTGPGIPKEHLSHVFDPFFTTKEAGSGLGMAVVHGIVSRHGGRIKAGNKKEGGAEISVFLKN